ncbi:histidine kinase dimerization/phosphoacceptor domain -containing protein [Spirosoma sp.]|uniref:tetratricopeptide repeat-containing sensor histidine kinase n=1 Tax=Spirosoma sp. TaxID=1899569 RepID=UPI0026152A96|nr:histidine kinase dimerization/phosphoacceptor domain -containing protein [Spirosoma sp.]MCX6216445.1 ATP-binding protein [Spirosoma sp.]
MPVRFKYARLLIVFMLIQAGESFSQSNWLPPSLENAPDSARVWTLGQIGDSLVNVGQLKNARQAYQQGLFLAQRMGTPRSIGLAYRGMGYWYEHVSDYTQAIVYYQQALSEFKKANDVRNTASTLYFISFSYDQLHNDKQAFHYAELGMKLARQAEINEVLVQFYEQMAHLLSHGKDEKQADAYMQKVLAYYKDKGDSSTYYTALFNSALMDKNWKLYTLAEDKFRRAEQFATKQKDAYFLGFIWASLPYALIPQNKLDEAEKYCRQALRWVQETGTNKYSMLADINDHLSHIAEKRGDYRQALFYYKQQVINRDSIVNETKNRQLAELETRYQTQQKEVEINQLLETNAVQERQIWAGIAGLIVLTLLLATLYWLYRRVQHSRLHIQQQSDQMALLMKELHHRVKNNLAIVSSLLKLQSNRLSDEKAVQAVREGQQRVEAMALIHQRLYQTEQVTTVDMREYLTDLSASLMRAYGHEADEFDLQLTVEQPKLDVDVAMPLGLIVNELATNAFKYAYNSKHRPFLRIALLNQETESGITLEVQDNGPGVDVAAWQLTSGPSSFGKRLIASLSEQLEGEFKFHRQDGTLFRLYVPEVRLQA